MSENLTQERADLLETLRAHRHFLKQTVAGLTEEQARTRSTVSELTLASLLKHVASTEASWAEFAVRGPESKMGGPPDYEAWAQEWIVGDDVTVADLLAEYDAVAARTDELVATADLDQSWPLPEAPWFEPGASRTVRRVLTHIVAETAQHSGHADIIRESIDGQKTMG